MRLFHSVRPRGWTADGGKAFARELQTGTWRNTEYAGMAQYKFLASGRYAYGQGPQLPSTISKRAPESSVTAAMCFAVRISRSHLIRAVA
jgi:hypothetical protein